MSRLRTALVALFLVAATITMVVALIQRPRIMVVQSYYTDYSWTRDVDTGIKRVLGKSTRYSMRWHYMDTKRNPSPEFKERAGQVARRAIDDWGPDVIIAVDDDAQQFVARHYLNDPDVAVVFAGVNNEPADYGYDAAPNVTGILERQKLDAVKGAILEIARNRGQADPHPRLLNLGDRSETVRGDAKAIGAYDWREVGFAGSTLVGTFAEWQQAVREAEGKVDFILTTNYRGLARSAEDPTLVPATEVAAWTEANAKPLIVGTYGFWVEDGGALAIGTSPYEQGEVATRMAMKIIDGVRPKDIPIDVTHHFVVFMRGSLIYSKGIKLPAIYEAFARATKNYID